MPGIQRFAVAVAGILLDTKNRVLLIHEAHGARQYGVPGGLVEDFDTPEEALEREFESQTGVAIRIDHVVGVRFRAVGEQSYVIIAYRCALVSGAAKVTGYGDIDEVGWFDVKALPRPMSPSIEPAIVAASLGGKGMVFAEDQAETQRRRRFRGRRDV